MKPKYTLGLRCKACDAQINCSDEELCLDCMESVGETLFDMMAGVDDGEE